MAQVDRRFRELQVDVANLARDLADFEVVLRAGRADTSGTMQLTADPQGQVLDLARKHQETDVNLSFTAAIERVFREHPDLYEAYRAAAPVVGAVIATPRGCPPSE